MDTTFAPGPSRSTGSSPSGTARPSPAVRRWRAARIARLLVPASAEAGGFVSAHLAVRLPGGRLARPDVGLACREPPLDGVLARAPDLVVTLRPEPHAAAEAAVWLAAGSAAVWRVGRQRVVEHRPDVEPRARLPDELLDVPGAPKARVRVGALLA